MSDQEVAQIEKPRLPFHPGIAKKFDIDIGQWKTLTDAIYPGAKTSDAVILALNYCRSRNLDPFKRPVHIVPIWDSKKGGYIETVWPGISELRTTAMRTKQYAGIDEAEFGNSMTVTFEGKVKKKEWEEVTKKVTFPEWCRITVYKLLDGQRVAFVGPKVFWTESYGSIGASNIPNDMWGKRAYGQLEKCAEAAALRRAFPEELGNEYAAEEMEGVKYQGPENAKVINPETERPRRSDYTEEATSGPEKEPETQSNSVPMYGFTDQFGEMGEDQLSVPDWVKLFITTLESIDLEIARDALVDYNQETIGLFSETDQKAIQEAINSQMSVSGTGEKADG